MTDQLTARRRRIAVIVGAAVVLVIAVVLVAVLTANGAARPAATPTSSGPTRSPSASASASATATATAAPPSPTPTVSASATGAPATVAPSSAPTPQPTRTAAISAPTAVPITKTLSATVVKTEAVTGTANGPGEIGGPSVRFTIRITNTTGSAFSLSDTVVNAYYGASATPAVQLQSPGGKDFPSSVADGASVTGVFVFNIPKASRSQVEVTVDTSVRNPVIAFKGAAPTG